MVHENETKQVIGCAMEVLNTLGHGLLEKPYENALVVEFGLKSIPCKQQPRFDVVYKSVRVGEYTPDLIVCDKVVVDTKVIRKDSGCGTWSNPKLPEDHKVESRPDPELQTAQAGVEESHSMNPSESIRVNRWFSAFHNRDWLP